MESPAIKNRDPKSSSSAAVAAAADLKIGFVSSYH